MVSFFLSGEEVERANRNVESGEVNCLHLFFFFFVVFLSIDESICFVILPQNMNFCST